MGCTHDELAGLERKKESWRDTSYPAQPLEVGVSPVSGPATLSMSQATRDRVYLVFLLLHIPATLLIGTASR